VARKQSPLPQPPSYWWAVPAGIAVAVLLAIGASVGLWLASVPDQETKPAVAVAANPAHPTKPKPANAAIKQASPVSVTDNSASLANAPVTPTPAAPAAPVKVTIAAPASPAALLTEDEVARLKDDGAKLRRMMAELGRESADNLRVASGGDYKILETAAFYYVTEDGVALLGYYRSAYDLHQVRLWLTREGARRLSDSTSIYPTKLKNPHITPSLVVVPDEYTAGESEQLNLVFRNLPPLDQWEAVR
jgi:hypothetical protein